jgi:hypothetical protein
METVNVGFANLGEFQLKISDIEKWTPKKITYLGDTVFFKHDDACYSMKTNDFKIIFNL